MAIGVRWWTYVAHLYTNNLFSFFLQIHFLVLNLFTIKLHWVPFKQQRQCSSVPICLFIGRIGWEYFQSQITDVLCMWMESLWLSWLRRCFNQGKRFVNNCANKPFDKCTSARTHLLHKSRENCFKSKVVFNRPLRTQWELSRRFRLMSSGVFPLILGAQFTGLIQQNKTLTTHNPQVHRT